MHSIVWRVVPAALPAWPRACARCSGTGLVPTGRFRVNANGPLHDVWLLYACPACGWGTRRSVLRRVREAAGLDLDPYRASDARSAALWAFHLGRGQPVAYRVDRPELAARNESLVAIEQPFPCRVRWDALLGRELAVPRARVRAGWGGALLPASSPFRARDPVRDGQTLVLRRAVGASSGRTRGAAAETLR